MKTGFIHFRTGNGHQRSSHTDICVKSYLGILSYCSKFLPNRVTCNRSTSCSARTFDGTGAQSRGRSSTSRRSCSLCQITSYILTNPWRLHLHAMPLHTASGQSYLPKCPTDQRGPLVTHLEHSTKLSGITPS